jgi:AraC-like DNA-binding protein
MFSIGARRLLRLLESYARLSGRAFPFQATLAQKLKCSDRTVRRYLRELCRAGRVGVVKRQHHSAEYRLLAVENVRSDVRSDVRSGAAHIGMSTEPELRASRPARKPPSFEVANYRTEFSEEWHRLHAGWTEPAGRVVRGQIRLIPNPEIVPVLADCARSAGFTPSQAILSLDQAVQNAEERVNRARNPPGLIIHIARSIWKAS